MTVFSCFLPYEQLPPIFDIFLMDGWRGIFRIGIALLREMEPAMLSMDMVDMCAYFRDNVRKEKVAPTFRLLSQASRVRVNPILVSTQTLPYLPSVFRSTTKSSKSSKSSSTSSRQRSSSRPHHRALGTRTKPTLFNGPARSSSVSILTPGRTSSNFKRNC